MCIRDSYGNTWTDLPKQVIPGVGSDGAVRLHYAANPIVGPGHTFAASGPFPSIAVQAHSGVITVLPFDEETGNAQVAGVSSAIDTTVLTPAQDGDLFVTGYISWATLVVPDIDPPFSLADRIQL